MSFDEIEKYNRQKYLSTQTLGYNSNDELLSNTLNYNIDHIDYIDNIDNQYVDNIRIIEEKNNNIFLTTSDLLSNQVELSNVLTNKRLEAGIISMKEAENERVERTLGGCLEYILYFI